MRYLENTSRNDLYNLGHELSTSRMAWHAYINLIWSEPCFGNGGGPVRKFGSFYTGPVPVFRIQNDRGQAVRDPQAAFPTIATSICSRTSSALQGSLPYEEIGKLERIVRHFPGRETTSARQQRFYRHVADILAEKGETCIARWEGAKM